MTLTVVVSNVAVQYPINDWLTWGAFTYPFAFLVTDLTNRALGAEPARRIVYVGFALAVGLSAIIATPRIATASGTAFLMGQLADVAIFDRLRRVSWWRAPLISSALASALDTVIFFSVAFAATGTPWVSWAMGRLRRQTPGGGVSARPVSPCDGKASVVGGNLAFGATRCLRCLLLVMCTHAFAREGSPLTTGAAYKSSWADGSPPCR